MSKRAWQATRAKLVALIAELVVTVVVTIVLHRKAKVGHAPSCSWVNRGSKRGLRPSAHIY